MMVVITISSCPPKLKGDLSRWFIEISTGVFVGNLNARVRDAVWNRICENIKTGQASMAFNTNNEQKMEFRIHRTDWEPVDFDGIKLVRRNLHVSDNEKSRQLSRAAVQHMNRLSQRKKKPSQNNENYVVIDIETTGLQALDEIIELGAVQVSGGNIIASFSALVRCHLPIPDEIQKLTGITDEQVQSQGICLKNALEQFLAFCGDYEIVGHNLRFDMQFLQKAFVQNGLPILKNKLTDTMKLSRKQLNLNSGYGLSAIAEYLKIHQEKRHRALDDCMLTYRIFEKLKEI